MLILLFKSSLCLLAFLLFYEFFLEKEKTHRFKRFYLLAISIIAVIIPTLTFTTYVNELPSETIVLNGDWNQLIPINNEVEMLSILIWSIYGVGILFFGFRLFRNLYKIKAQINNNEHIKLEKNTFVLLPKQTVPHTFFNYIFVNKSLFKHNSIPNSVLIHEKAHAKQKHSLDILFIEIITCLLWFNPLIYILKKKITLNHEFLADESVLKKGFKLQSYQQTLLHFGDTNQFVSLTHSINYKPLKKRFILMKKERSKKTSWLKSLLILPLIAILTFSFSNKVVAQNKEKEQKQEQEGVTPEMIAKYNKLAKFYNAKKEADAVIKIKDLEGLTSIYWAMTEEQKKAAEPFPNFPPPPPPPPLPAPIKIEKGQKKGNNPPPPPPIEIEEVQEESNEKPPSPPVKKRLAIEEIEEEQGDSSKNSIKEGNIEASTNSIEFYLDGRKITPKEAETFSQTHTPPLNITVSNKDGKDAITKLFISSKVSNTDY